MGTAGTTIHELFEAQVARTPGATAVGAGAVSLTYAELDARANRLAHHLLAMGAGPDRLVGVCLGRSVDLAVALLGVLKAGAGCVPLDPSYPTERLGFMVEDAAVAAVVSSAAVADRLPAIAVPVVRIDADAARWTSRPTTRPTPAVGPQQVAYVLYTSGSTGTPKGVLLTHAGLVNHARGVLEVYGLEDKDRVLQLCSIGFDTSIEEMFPTWAAGAAVVFRSDDALLLGRDWLRWLRAERISVMELPTSYWHEWTRDLEAMGETVPDHLRLVAVGGDRALGRICRTWFALGGCRWVNTYGPTETSIVATAHEPVPGRADDRDPPIGRPLPNVAVYVVDPTFAPVPVGVPGEMLIGGAGLAAGYLNRPELTAERFVADPFDPTPGARVYRTGDMARRRADGGLEFVGRLDEQVKIRGFRVECGEVEAALARSPMVGQAVVVAPEDPTGDRRLVAYVVPSGSELDTSKLRSMLRASLPDHMVPTAFVRLAELPLTVNGKVDRRALPAPDADALSAGRARVAPRSPTEASVARIWAGVLGLDEATLSVDDDFFDVGGHSLLATQVIAQVREEFGTETPLRVLFEAPTLAGLAAAIAAETTRRPDGGPLTAQPRRPGARLPLSFAQEQMWRLETSADPQGLYNVTLIETFDRSVDEQALRQALAYMSDRHEILRTCFPVDAGTPSQSVASATDVELRVSDLRGEPAALREPELRRRIASEDAEPFDLALAPLFRAHLFRLDEESSRLTVTFDHLVCDGASTIIFAREMAQAYESIVDSRVPDLPPLSIQFADFSVWQRAHLTPEVMRRQLDWWVTTFGGMRLGPAVPFDRMPASPTRRISSRSVTVPAGTRRLLDEVARATHSTVFTVVAAAVQTLCHRYAGTTDVVFSTTLSGRSRAELEPLIGTFAGIGRIRAELSGDLPFTEVVRRTRDVVLGMFDNQDIPFMRVRRELLPDFPAGGPALAAALPTEFQYFRTNPDKPDPELFFRGQLHPLSFSLFDDGREMTGGLSYKLDFYEAATIDALAEGLESLLAAVAEDPTRRVSELPLGSPTPPPAVADGRAR